MKRRDKAVSSRLAIPWNSPQSLFNYTGQIVPVYGSAESRHHRAGEITWGVQSGLYCSVQNKKLKLKFFSSRPLPCHSSPLSLFSSHWLDTEIVGQRLGARLQTSSLSCALSLVIHNITGALVSMHPFLPFPGIPILLHTLSVLVPFSFSPNNNGTISLKLLMLINS